MSEAGTIALAGTTHTLSIADGTLSDGQYAVLVFGGAPSGTNTVTLSPNDAKRVFIVKNDSGESVVLTQGSGGNVTVTDGKTAIVYSDGAGSIAAVVNVSADFVSGTIADIGALTPSDGTFIVGNGTTWVAETGNTVLQSIGVTATTAEINTLDGIAPTGAGFGFVPQGGIIMWSGSIASIPSGWNLCDGTNGTPDLRDRFVVGAGNTYAVDETGGANTVALAEANLAAHTHSVSGTTASDGAHTHTVSGNTSNTGAHTHTVSGNTSNTGAHTHSGSTSNTGSHNHRLPDAQAAGGNNPLFINSLGNGSTANFSNNAVTFSAGAHSHNFTTDSQGSHSHTLSGTADSAGAHTHTLSGTADSAGAHTHSFSTTSGSTGSGTAHENRPPYYALAYIMKT